ncbi:hypothetical protein CXF85_00840 [Colwellia sp. 75C3]|uniref:hypothetical protein n=1 Tax=Colwellia sp. 75C3 TaxID=888425 RepID=UPI000C33ECAA|nr:hypothetical protein [Colwellia sp. 75C3]PKG86288.1 hypothetical protein CXF85_00840 [Colwellia sp. 75C3]
MMDEDKVSNKKVQAEEELKQIQSAYSGSVKRANNINSKISSIKILPKRIVIGKPYKAKDVIYECTNKHELAQLVFGSLCLVFHEVIHHPNDYAESKVKSIIDQFPNVTAFINQHETNGNDFKIIKNFETYLVDEGFSGRGAYSLISIVREACSVKFITPKKIEILKKIDKSTKLNPLENKQYPLTKWFSQIRWLREEMAKAGKLDVYQRISSTRLLMKSFSHTISELMLIIQDFSLDIAKALQQNHFNLNLLKSKFIDVDQTSVEYKKQREILYIATRGDLSINKQTLEILISDFCPKDRRSIVSNSLRNNDNFSTKPTEKKKVKHNFRTAAIFDEDFFSQIDKFASGKQTSIPVSKAEELCFYWLNCAQAVQASDVRQLTYQDYIFHGSSKRITHISCDYYKSRSQDFKTTDTLDTTLSVGKALLYFIQNKGNANSLMSLKSKDVDSAMANHVGFIARVLSLFSEPLCNELIKKRLRQQAVSTVFLDLVQCLLSNATCSKQQFDREQKKQNPDIKNKHHFPSNWFTGSMIKTAAVHAGSLKFRVGLINNHNSHTSKTEHDVYFSEENEEYMNMSGRLMRFVMEDIENVAFKPNIEQIHGSVTERQLRTKLVSETTGDIQPFNKVEYFDGSDDEQGDSIIVIDSVETVVNFLHYINEARKKYKMLAQHNPDFLEMNVLVEAEWKEYVLNNLISKQIKSKGYATYKQYKPMLPELFVSQIRV